MGTLDCNRGPVMSVLSLKHVVDYFTLRRVHRKQSSHNSVCYYGHLMVFPVQVGKPSDWGTLLVTAAQGVIVYLVNDFTFQTILVVVEIFNLNINGSRSQQITEQPIPVNVSLLIIYTEL